MNSCYLAPRTTDFTRNLDVAFEVCQDLNVPVATHKVEGPTSTVTFLSIDTIREELRLPAEKLDRLHTALQEWSQRHSCTKRDLLSPIGTLQHAASGVKLGHIFLRRLSDLSTVPRNCITSCVLITRHGQTSWKAFASRWNGISLLDLLGRTTP